MKLVPGGATDQGMVRDSNEDGYVVDRRLQLFAIADGMGGHRAGEVASATALEALRASVASGTGIGDAITSANAAVFSKATDDESLSGMGTTLTALIPDADGVLVGHVGDSRAYLLRDGELRQLTTDHSLVQEFIREGRLTEEQAAVHPQRSIITRALGVEADVEVDVYPVRLRAGDRLLLCSDGLSTMLRNDDIAGLLRRESDPTRAANLLVDAANAAGGEDNITTVVVDVEDDGADPFAPAPASVSPSVTTATPAALAGTEAAGTVAPTAGRSHVDDATAAIPIVDLPDGGKSMTADPADAGAAKGGTPRPACSARHRRAAEVEDVGPRPAGRGDRGAGARGARAGRAQAGAPPGALRGPVRTLRRADSVDPRPRGRRHGLVRAPHLLRRLRPPGPGDRVPGPARWPAAVGSDDRPPHEDHQVRPPRGRPGRRRGPQGVHRPGCGHRVREPHRGPRRGHREHHHDDHDTRRRDEHDHDDHTPR